jgi:hypothetical protein
MEEKPSIFKASVVPGLILGIVLIVFSLIMFVMDVDRESKVNWISFVVMVGVLYWAMTTIRDKTLGGFASYGQAFKAGFFVVLIGSIIAGIYFYIHIVALDPGMVDEIMMQQEEEILSRNPDISDEELEFALGMTEKFTSPPMLAFWGTFANLLFGTVFSLLIAIFVKRENNNPA